ncbi:hypothetical protein CDD83_10300 [Cordyceps sp. RAO-2017]|nr:hypothetical protein CDD83_10300 [Cordyceps sp. RAO-2017]
MYRSAGLNHGNRGYAAPSPSRVVEQPDAIDVIDIDSDSSAATNESDFPDIDNIDIRRRPSEPRRLIIQRSHSETVTSAAPSTRRVTARRSDAQTAEERQRRAAAKAIEKERKRREREQAKDAKAKEKARAAALAEANKLRTDKKISTPEMIVDLPSALASEDRLQVEGILETLRVEHSTWESPEQCIVKWRRKVTSRFDEQLGRWEPIPPRIQEERHALVILTAEQFVALVLQDQLAVHVSRVREQLEGHEIIYLLQGLTPWIRKNRNLRNRQFAAGVRANQPSSTTTTQPAARGRRGREGGGPAQYIPEDQVEDAVLRLQVEHDVLVHHTTVPVETARWVATFTQHISTIPYKRQRDHATATAGFCMESGQVRSGEGPRDTYVRMLQEIVRITAPIAYGVLGEFDGVSRLVEGLEAGGPHRLEGVNKCANKDGLQSDRVIGQAVSRRLHKVFTGRDPTSTDV